MGYIAVIDTETNWEDQVMSIGIALADDRTFNPADTKYFVITPECENGGMYSDVLDLVSERKTVFCSMKQAMGKIKKWLGSVGTSKMFAYNACFDRNHLTELSSMDWYDIMRVAAYRQHNRFIPRNLPCCRTGRLKSHFGVEAITHMLTGDGSYAETHNALYDALDELKIIR